MSTFNAQFAQRLLTNLQTRLETNLNTQVAAVDAALTLFSVETDIAAKAIGFNTPTEIATNFPCIYLEPSLSRLDQSADDSRIDQQHEFLLSLAITGPDADALKTRIVKYVTAIDRCLRQMTVAQMIGSAPTSSIRAPVWEITEHRYGVITTDKTIYRRDAQLILVVQTLER